MILCIDTAIERCGIGIYQNGAMIDCSDSETSMRASEILHQMIRELLERNSINMNHLEAIAINGGPGSYTGLRIGAASAKGFCFALDIPLIHINGLELMTEGIRNRMDQKDYDFYIPMIDARRNEVFTAVYDSDAKEVMAPKPMVLESTSFQEYIDSKCLFFGNGALKSQPIINISELCDHKEHFVKTMDFKNLVSDKWERHHFEDVVNYAPHYLKKFHSTSPKTS